MSAWPTGSSPRRAATRSRCSSCRAGSAPRSSPAASGCRTPAPLSGSIESQLPAPRWRSSPRASRRLLLIAAAEPVGDPSLVWRAAERLGVDVDAAAPATAADLLTVGTHVRFRHPLVRSAVYRSASLEERRAVHEALAQATDPDADPDRRAWHRAQAAAGPDEAVAAELERSAGRAQARGGLAAAAAFLERAMALTADPAQRTRRAFAAVQAALRRRRVRHGLHPARHGRARAAGRARSRPRRAVAGADRHDPEPRLRGACADAARGPAPGGARRGARA